AGRVRRRGGLFFYRQPQPDESAAHGAEVDGGAEAVAEFGQGGVGLLADEDYEAVALGGAQLDAVGAAAGPGGEGAGLAAALEEASNPGGGDAKEGGDVCAGADAGIAGADNPLAEVLRIGVHTSLYAPAATKECEA